MKSILLVMILLNICSCSGVSRPDADICIINFASDKPAHLHCQNMKSDYSPDGVLLPGHPAHDKLIGAPQSLNAGKYISKEDWPKFQVFMQDLRDYAKVHCQ